MSRWRASPCPGCRHPHGAALRTVLAGDDEGAKNDQGVGILRCQPLVLYGVPDWSRTSGLSLRSQGRQCFIRFYKVDEMHCNALFLMFIFLVVGFG